MNTSKIQLTTLEKAIKSLESIVQKPVDDIVRDATIQRFEYTYELAWKTLKRYLKSENVVDETVPIKTLYREAARKGLIDKVESWFAYHDARNLTTHVYEEKIADEVYQVAKCFVNDARKLFQKLQEVLKNAAR